MPTPDPRQVLSAGLTLTATLYSLDLAFPDLAAQPIVMLAAGSAPILALPLRRLLQGEALRTSLLAAALTIGATEVLGGSIATLSLSLSLLALTISLADITSSKLSPDLFGATLAVGAGLTIGLKGIILIAGGLQAPLWATVALTSALALLGLTAPSSPSCGSTTGSLWLIVTLGALPSWTNIDGLSTAATWSPATIVFTLLASSTLAMTLLPALEPGRYRLLMGIAFVCSIIGTQVDATQPIAAGLGLLVLPFLVRTAALQSRPTVSDHRVDGLNLAAGVLGITFGSRVTSDRWEIPVDPGTLLAGAALLPSLFRPITQTSYEPAQPSVLHWPGVAIAIGATACLSWLLTQ